MKGYEHPEKIYESPGSLVYRAFDEKNNRSVVLKVLNSSYPAPDEISRFNREYELTAGFTNKSEGVIEVYELSKIDNSPAIVMEDIGGQSLADILKSMKLHPGEFLNLAIRISEIIGTIHKRNIIHKDINPSNIIWNIEKNIVRIIDFGIATELPREITSVKNPNVLEGTLSFISPEQTGRMNRSLDYRTDFYSLGVTFYWMLTGRLPFESKDLLKLVHSHIAILPVPPHDIDESIPEALSNIVMKLTAKNAEDRYLSAHGLKVDLERCRQKLRDSGAIDSFAPGQHDVSDKFQIPQKLYGREQEIKTLLSAFERVREAGTELMLVSGFSGIGKSMLINEIQKPIVKHRGYFISGKFERLKKDVPYSGIIQAFTGLARQILAEGDDAIKRWKEKILPVLEPNGKIITGIIPLFELIIGKQWSVPTLNPVESQNRFNLVFKEFMKVLASKEHPLVLFLDDLQWADFGSLHLLELFTTDPDIKHLFLIGAYRHNETPDSHPLILTLATIRKTGRAVNNIFLRHLTEEHVSRLLADTLNRPAPEMESPAALLIRKTGGNPFFINEFLKTLYKEHLIEFSFEHGWSWDTTGIEETQVTHNVVDLMAGKITELQENSQEVLKLGACIGSYVNLSTLVMICEKTEKEILSALNELLREEMLNKTDSIYRFSHDRILEAAYSLISGEEKVRQHYRIGNLELNNTKKEELPEKIFYIVNQLNAGENLVRSRSEKVQLAELNRMAGKKALASNAYESALNYLEAGIGLLEENCWQQNYDLTHELYQEAAIAAGLGAEYETMTTLAKAVFQNARTILDTIKVNEAKIFACAARNQLQEGIDIGLTVLKKLGVRLPEKPGKVRIAGEILLIKLLLIGKPVKDLINLPEMEDPYKLAVMRIMTGLGSIAYYAAPEQLLLGVLYTVKFSIKYGNNIYSPYSYAGFAIIHSGVLGDISTGHEYGKLALKLVEKFNIKESNARVGVVAWYLGTHLKMPLRDSLKPLLEAYKTGLETGDLEFAALSANAYCEYLFYSGMELAGTEKEIAKYAEAIRKLNQDTCLNYQRIVHQVVLNLQGKSSDPCRLIGSSYDENNMLAIHKETNDMTAIFTLYYNLLNLNYLFENYKEALKNAELVQSYIETQISHPALPIINFYDSLTRLALKTDLGRVRKNQKKMKKYAFHAPMNHSHKYHLVEAEIARIRGQKLKAMDHYKRAVQLAHENKFLQEEALALKLSAQFRLEHDEEIIAALYMRKALHAYRVWGAAAVVNHIEKKYGSLAGLHSERKNPSSPTVTNSSTSTGSSEVIDLSTVIKTSQMLSGEIDLGRLLEGILKFSIENAGAERGFLIIENESNKNLYIEAEGEAEKKTTVLESVPIENSTRLSSTIVRYVNKTSENIVLNNAHKEGGFTDDPYVIENKTKSLLCAPITHKGKISGILYLENNLTTNCFTGERLELLRILTSQAAISIENARLLVHRENGAKLEKEMEIAANIQTGLLPQNPFIKDYEISAYMNPADDVGGDYYDIINAEGRDWIVIGDVSGHGVPAGLIMMMVQTSIHTVLTQHPNIPPSELLTVINRVIKDNITLLNEEKYMTITVFAARRDGEFIFSGLHQDIMIFRANSNTVDQVRTEGMWVGMFDNIQEEIRDDSLFLNTGDIMLVYTDGITEAWKKGTIKHKRNPDTDMFGEDLLKDIFRKFGKKPVEEIKNGILAELENYDCSDDVTMVLVKRRKKPDF